MWPFRKKVTEENTRIQRLEHVEFRGLLDYLTAELDQSFCKDHRVWESGRHRDKQKLLIAALQQARMKWAIHQQVTKAGGAP